MSFNNRAARLREQLMRNGRVEMQMVFFDDPEENLDEFRLPDSVLNLLHTIEVGRPEPGGEPESGAEWVARLTREVEGERG